MGSLPANHRRLIPPRDPHFGGLWEAAVKSAKFYFYRVVGASILAINELRTLSYEVLTPAYFLKDSSYTKFPEPDISHHREGRLSRWQRVTQMQQHFWKRWSTEYLYLLQESRRQASRSVHRFNEVLRKKIEVSIKLLIR